MGSCGWHGSCSDRAVTYAKEAIMRRFVLVAGHGGLAVALALTACGGDGSSDNSMTGTTPMAPTTNALTISIVGQRGEQSFSPNPASAGAQMVMWRNDNGETHRIVANDGSFDTGEIAPGATSGMVQAPEGGLNYHCSIHPTTMFGAIGAAGGGAPPPCVGLYCD
jgi:plastocyanin